MSGAQQPPAWIRAYQGLRYVNGGRGPTGFDCYGIMAVGQNDHFGLSVPLMQGEFIERPPGQSRAQFLALIRSRMFERAGWIKVDQPRPGDGIDLMHGAHCGLIVALRPRPAGAPPAGWMLHVHEGIDVTCEEFHNDKWKNKVSGFWRFVGAGGGHG